MTVTILDGGISRELERVGAPFRQPEWSALALMETPDLVAEVHRRFARAGAQVISTNSYAVVPFHLGEALFNRDGAMLAARAGQLGRSVADEFGILVAGSLPPAQGSYRPDLFDAAVARPVLETLVRGLAPSIDLWIAETLSSLDEAALVADVLTGQPHPVWLSFTLDDAHAVLRSGETIARAVRLAVSRGAKAILFNCSCPEVMNDAVCQAKAALAGSTIAIGVYANGFETNADSDDANAVVHSLRPDLDPDAYLDYARLWVASGATLIGGCCGIGPDHIAALSVAFGKSFMPS